MVVVSDKVAPAGLNCVQGKEDTDKGQDERHSGSSKGTNESLSFSLTLLVLSANGTFSLTLAQPWQG